MTRIWLGALLAATIAGALFYAGAEWAKRDNLKDYIDGTKDATDATDDLPDTDDGILDWLRDFSK